MEYIKFFIFWIVFFIVLIPLTIILGIVDIVEKAQLRKDIKDNYC